MPIIGDMDVINGVIESGEDDVRQGHLLHLKNVNVDGALVLAGALAVPLAPVRWTCNNIPTYYLSRVIIYI